MKIYVIENSYHRLSNLVEGCRLIKNGEKLGKKKKEKEKKTGAGSPNFPNSQIPK